MNADNNIVNIYLPMNYLFFKSKFLRDESDLNAY